MLLAIFPLLLAILGALVYALAGNPKLAELGRGAYWAGLFALAFTLAAHTVHIG